MNDPEPGRFSAGLRIPPEIVETSLCSVVFQECCRNGRNDSTLPERPVSILEIWEWVGGVFHSTEIGMLIDRLRVHTALWVGGFALLAAPLTSSAQEGGQNGERPGTPVRPFVQAGVLNGSVQIDGRLDDAVWQGAEVARGFIQRDPVEGAPAEQDTEVRVLFDDQAIYIAARMFDSDPSAIGDQLVRRDDQGQFDFFEVSFDPNLDRRTGYQFRVSAANVQGDRILFNDTEEDGAWDAVWDSEVQIDDEGWTVEMRIPLSQIRFEASSAPQEWGVNFFRRRIANDESTYFSLESELQRGRVSQFGTLTNVLVQDAPGRLELRPYVLSGSRSAPSESGDPFFDGHEFMGRVGAELSYGLGSSFTLNATINPDFGQVESDPAVINLSAFETFFEEQRPFFVEDSQAFEFELSGRQNRLFHSRRIGRNPQGRGPSGSDFSDIPDAATILGAAKVSGRTEGGLSLGVLAAITDSEEGEAFFADGDSIRAFPAEPQTSYGVVRVQQDFNGGASQIGGIGTMLYRDLPGDGAFDFLPSQAYTYGIDFEHQWGNREWALSGFFAASHVRGDSTALIRIQRNSNHFFQRPDTDRLSVDSTATAMSGAEWRLEFARRSGQHWTGAVWIGEVTPGFEINDFGFARGTEKLDIGTRISYREIRPGDLFRNYRINFFTFHNFSHDVLDDVFSSSAWGNAHTSGSFNLDWNAQLLNYWNVNTNVRYNPSTMRRTSTRGGPIMENPSSIQYRVGFNTDRRKALSFGTNINVNKGRSDSQNSFQTGADVTLRPAPWVTVSLRPNWQREFQGAQYVTSTSTLSYEPTFGRRYLFADLERRTFSMETRLNMSFTPDLTLQLFAQPLLSSGDFVRYKQLADSGTFDFLRFEEGTFSEDTDGVTCSGGQICEEVQSDGDRVQHVDFDGDDQADFSFGDRDFNTRSLIGNAVIRWEYRPGSTIFLVWQHRRRDQLNIGDFAFGDDVSGLFDAPAENVFMLKISQYIGL